MPQKHRREGWVQVDHTYSPGVPEEMLRKFRETGKDVIAVGPGQRFESAFVVCCHCGTPVILNPDRSRPRGYCRSCDNYVCDNKECNDRCTPRMKTLDLLQEQAFRQEAGLNPLLPGPGAIKIRGI